MVSVDGMLTTTMCTIIVIISICISHMQEIKVCNVHPSVPCRYAKFITLFKLYSMLYLMILVTGFAKRDLIYTSNSSV